MVRAWRDGGDAGRQTRDVQGVQAAMLSAFQTHFLCWCSQLAGVVITPALGAARGGEGTGVDAAGNAAAAVPLLQFSPPCAILEPLSCLLASGESMRKGQHVNIITSRPGVSPLAEAGWPDSKAMP